MNRKYGLKPFKADIRDIPLMLAPPKVLPVVVDHRQEIAQILDQGQENDCLCNAGMLSVRHARKLAGLPDMISSRQFNYWNVRAIEGDTNQDGGGQLRSVYQAIRQYGYCPESMWEYDQKNVFTKPPQECFDVAMPNILHNYAVVNTRNLIACKQCLAHGFLFEIGFLVPASFEDETPGSIAETGIMKMQLPGEWPNDGHAVTAVGYDDSKSWFIMANSWGDKWGDKGYFYMPYEFMIGPLVIEAWMLRISKTGLQ